MPALQELIATDTRRPTSVNFESCRPFLIVWAIYLLLCGFGLKFAFFPSGFAERMDFRQLYTGAILARTAPSQLYNWEKQKEVQDAVVSKAVGLLPYNHPPYEAIFLRPLSWLPYRSAFLATALINVALLGACFFLCRDEFSHTGAFALPRPGFQIFAFFPTTVAIFHGQDSIHLQLADLVVLLISLGVMSASQSHPITIARASLFIAPPFLTMLGVNFLCLLASVVLLLAYGMMTLE